MGNRLFSAKDGGWLLILSIIRQLGSAIDKFCSLDRIWIHEPLSVLLTEASPLSFTIP